MGRVRGGIYAPAWAKNSQQLQLHQSTLWGTTRWQSGRMAVGQSGAELHHQRATAAAA